jgi:hypothetical protein
MARFRETCRSKLRRNEESPFDRLLVAQAIIEGITLLTADIRVTQYAGPVQRVQELVREYAPNLMPAPYRSTG